MRVQKKPGQEHYKGIGERLRTQKQIVVAIAVVFVMMFFWISAVPLLHWFERLAEEAELDDNLNIWRASDKTNYRFSFSVTCLCDDATSDPITVVVRESTHVRARTATTNELVDIADYPAVPPTIDALFEALASSLRAYPDSIDVTYDPIYGVPLEIRIDRDRDLAGDEIGYYLRQFEPDDDVANDR